MEEGVKIVVTVMVVLIIAFAVVFIFSERIMGTNENILKPIGRDGENAITSARCRATRGEYYTVSHTCESACHSVGKTVVTPYGCGDSSLIGFCCCEPPLPPSYNIYKNVIVRPSICTLDCMPDSVESNSREKCGLTDYDTAKCCCKCI